MVMVEHMTPGTGPMSSITVYLSSALTTQGRRTPHGGYTRKPRNNQGLLETGFPVSRGGTDLPVSKRGCDGLLNNFMS